MFVFIRLQLVLMALTTANSYIVSSSGDEQVAFSLKRDGRFFSGLIIDTYWCGSGNVSRRPYELGPNIRVDECCMIHDYCPVFINPGEVKYGRINNGKYTQASCKCDQAFYDCLENVNSWSAWAVIAAFAATRPDCIELAEFCISPGGDYQKNPCAGYRCSSDCEIITKGVKKDSKFKKYQMERDREEANKETETQNRGMLHQSTSPHMHNLLLPTIMNIF